MSLDIASVKAEVAALQATVDSYEQSGIQTLTESQRIKLGDMAHDLRHSLWPTRYSSTELANMV